jgi:hypothetical protein
LFVRGVLRDRSWRTWPRQSRRGLRGFFGAPVRALSPFARDSKPSAWVHQRSVTGTEVAALLSSNEEHVDFPGRPRGRHTDSRACGRLRTLDHHRYGGRRCGWRG